MTKDQAQEAWELVEKAMQSIYAQEMSSLSYEVLYRTVYNLVFSMHGEMLYTGVERVVTEHLTHKVERFLNENQSQLSDVWGFVLGAYQEHCTEMGLIQDVLMYMDKVYCTDGRMASYELGLVLFREGVANNTKIKTKLREVILGSIEVRVDRVGLLFVSFCLAYIFYIIHDNSPPQP